MTVIESFCASGFILHGRLTLFALRLPFQMRFHWFDAHLLFPAAVSIRSACSAIYLSFARRVDGQNRVRPNLAVPSLTSLPIWAVSCRSCIRLEPVTNCHRSSQTDPGTTYNSDWTSSNKRPLAQEQLWRQPSEMLEAHPVMTSLKPLPTWTRLGDLCVSALRAKISIGYPLATNCGISRCAFVLS